MTNEIDLHPLFINGLQCKVYDYSPYTIGTNKEDTIRPRKFETNKIWTKKEQTSYIESIFLHCALQPIIRFVSQNHTIIVDGYNRFLAIQNFCNNKLVLQENGLKQLKFLANKNFKKLTEKEINYFYHCDQMKIIDYSYQNAEKPITEEGEIEIQKYLYVIYNTILRLEIEEIQKAQFLNDNLTIQIKEKLQNDDHFFHKIEQLNLLNTNKKRNKIENILLNCRLLVASTYSNIYDFSNTNGIEERIEKNYLPNIKDLDSNEIFQDFNLNIELIHNKLIQTQKWKNYPILNNRPFIEATYWLISVIRKDHLFDPVKFDFMKYLDYFGTREEIMQNFPRLQANYKKNIYKKYKVVADYFTNETGIPMDVYFKKIDKQTSTPSIKNIEDLFHNNISCHVETKKVRDFLKELESGNTILRPPYQRKEVMNISLASKVIESILLGIKLPSILVHQTYKDDNIITEVVDGQQRILAILGFLEKPFRNMEGNLEFSNKSGYKLKNLRILHHYNNHKFQSDQGPILSNKDIEQILNSDLYIFKTTTTKRNYFDAVDNFVRLNKNICMIKENTYIMWSLTSDAKIIDYEKEVTKPFIGKLLPKQNQKRIPHMITLKLASYISSKINEKDEQTSMNRYSNISVSTWLQDFNKQKEKDFYQHNENIQKNRENYYHVLDLVEEFYQKCTCFLEQQNITVKQLFYVLEYKNAPLIYYYYLYALLGDISKSDICNHAFTIRDIVQSFFKKIKEEKMKPKAIESLLAYKQSQIRIYNTK